LVAGAGNIGSPLALLLARLGIGLIRIADRDRVDVKNVTMQDYCVDDVGRFKAEVLAERVRRNWPEISVEAYTCDIEDIPRAVFDVDVVLGALDSRHARQFIVSDISWPMGITVIDGGVGLGYLGRVQVFRPGRDSGCWECTQGADDYFHLAAEYPCAPGSSPSAPATNAPAYLGTVVAGFMAAECARILDGRCSTESREIALDLDHGRSLVSRLARSPRCRFDHRIVTEAIELGRPFPVLTVGDILHALDRRFGDAPVHLEFRRGLRLGDPKGAWASRFVAIESLRPESDRSLAGLGLSAEDRIRVRSSDDSAFIVLTGIRDESREP
jgi:molybdopterin/thiamine biosynthesis adenylyltransferase